MIAPTALSVHSDGDSDSDWDDDDDFGVKKINIKIKPIAQVTPSKISASVDELRATVETWKSMAGINLVKPNSRRHHQSNIQLNTINNNEGEAFKLPVAFAIQECLNAKLLVESSTTSLIGRVKMAVPLIITSLNIVDDLDVTFISSKKWNTIKLNHEFVRELDKHDRSNSLLLYGPSKRLLINTRAVQAYVRNQHQKQSNNRYFILPELLNYTLGSHEEQESFKILESAQLNPLGSVSHWLCDLNMTKVRMDIKLSDKTLIDQGLSTDDIKNLKISMHVDGGVTSYQSKPAADWNSLSSKLTWSFSNLTELIQESTVNGVTSCLARFNLDDGPSSPADINLQFSIAGKTLSGSQIVLNSTRNFRLAKQKYEVRTGAFRCEPPCR